MSCLNRLSVVNNTLERLGTPKNYAKLRTRVIWLIVGWMIVSFMMDIVDNVWFIMHTSTFTVVAVCLPYIINHTLHINALYDFTFMALLGCVRIAIKMSSSSRYGESRTNLAPVLLLV